MVCYGDGRGSERRHREADWKLHSLPLEDAFFLWKQTGDPVEDILVEHRVIEPGDEYSRALSPWSSPPLYKVCSPELDPEPMCCLRSNSDVFVLPMRHLRQVSAGQGKTLQAVLALPEEIFFSLEEEFRVDDASDLSIAAREQHVAYQVCSLLPESLQVSQMLRVRKALEVFEQRPQPLRRFCSSDIPPTLRARVWAKLLGVTRDKSEASFHPEDSGWRNWRVWIRTASIHRIGS